MRMNHGHAGLLIGLFLESVAYSANISASAASTTDDELIPLDGKCNLVTQTKLLYPNLGKADPPGISDANDTRLNDVFHRAPL